MMGCGQVWWCEVRQGTVRKARADGRIDLLSARANQEGREIK